MAKSKIQIVLSDEIKEYIDNRIEEEKRLIKKDYISKDKIRENLVKENNGCGCWWYQLPDYMTVEEFLEEE